MAKTEHGEDSSHWRVFVEWSGRNALTPLSSRSLSARRARQRVRAENSEDGLPHGCDSGFDFDLGGIVFAIVFGLFLFAIWPLFAPVFAAGAIFVVAIVEVFIVILVAAIVILTKTLFGRPWRVVAINHKGETWSWKQTGWGEAHRLVERIEAELAAGAQPERIAPGNSIPEGLSQLPDDVGTGLASETWVRATSKIVAVAITIWSIYRVLVAIYG